MPTRMEKITAGLAALDSLEVSPDYIKRMATASDPEDMKKKIEALRQHFKSQAVQVGYESKQKLANLLREVTHVLTDVIHFMNVVGEDSKSMRKLQVQVGNVTRSLSFVGEDDEDGDGFRDDVPEDEKELDLGDDTTTDDAQEAFKSAVKSIKKEEPAKPEEKEQKKEPVPVKPEKEATKEETEDADEDTEDTEEEQPQKVVKKKKIIPLKKKKQAEKPTEDSGEESEKGGFVSSLLGEGSDEATSAYEATAGFRFVYLGLKTVKKQGSEFQVVRSAFGSHSSDTLKVYYYKPTKKFFGGDAEKVDRVFRKLLESANGYAKLSTEISARLRSGHLELVSKKEQPAAQILGVSEGAWSYRGVDTHPKNEDKKALWFEIGSQEFAAIPAKTFEHGDVEQANGYISTKIIGSKEHGGIGLSYINGLNALEQLVDSGKLKVIYHGNL